MNVFSYQYCDVLRGEYIYRKSFTGEMVAFNEYHGLWFVQLFSGVIIT